MKQVSDLGVGMSRRVGKRISRRELLQGSFVAGGTLLLGFDKVAWSKPLQDAARDPLAGGRQLGVVGFSQEAPVPMETAFGEGLDGRMYTDLSRLTPQTAVTATERFYVRTRASELLEGQKTWVVRLNGLLTKPIEFSLGELNRSAKPMGVHLLECAGNARSVHFGLMSAADWAGLPLLDLVETAKANPQSRRIVVSGFDTYPTKSVSSQPGASWVFTWDELKRAKAFLATEMNGNPLTRDHGAPIRLIVPGWYGCVCIKWVNEIRLVDDAAEATSQMQEFAGRTQQQGVPGLVRDYKPATIEQAAMPTRIEKWLVGERIVYRVTGILWGGSRPVNTLEIRFNPEEDYVAVESVQQRVNDPWSFWTHKWSPKQPGTYLIRLRIKELQIAATRLNAGYYLRSVEITEV
jgi:DMSO/TMAO reductase YedYZ molybdopterin-dependent catalytic subunit